VADVIPIDHIRRSRRLFRILVDRLGIDHFLAPGSHRVPRIDPQRADEAIALTSEWIQLRTGGTVDPASREVMERQLRRLLILYIAEALVGLAIADEKA
jgi:hypothetical protein